MRFSFSEEQEQFRAQVRRFLERHSPAGEVRRLMATDDGYDPDVWRRLSQDLGLTGLHVPEAHGGAGFGFVELSLVTEEMGRALLCAPYLGSSVLATCALLDGATDAARAALLPAIASGERIASLALAEHDGAWDPRRTALKAERHAEHHVLDGVKTFVVDGHVADLFVVAARTSGSAGEPGVTLFHVEGDAPGLERRLLETLDPTRKQATLTFDSVPAVPIGEPGAASDSLDRTLDRANVALACEMVGGAQRLFDMTLDYAKLRMQFGRLIGSFQAIKHRFADLLLELELARSAAYHAAAAIAGDDPEVPALASLAKAMASDMYMHMAVECIQIHGGIGFTWDHDAHLWFRRAKSSQVMFGDATHHRERYMQQVA